MPDMKEKFAQLDQAIQELKDQPGALMPVLQRAQNIFGCVSLDVQKRIAEGLGVTLSEVYGVATFCAQFSPARIRSRIFFPLNSLLCS